MLVACRVRSFFITLLCALIVSCGWSVVCPRPVWAASPALIGMALAPLEAESSVEMIGLAVDVRLRATQGHALAGVSCRFHLHNRDRLEARQIRLGFPRQVEGDAIFDPTALSGLRLTVDGQPVALEPDGSYAAWTQSFAADATVMVEMDYTVDLGNDPIITLRYDPTPAAEWATRIDGVRITFHLPQPTTTEQILEMKPDDLLAFDGQRITWLAEYAEPSAPLMVRVISPPIWNEIVAAREAIATDPVSAEKHYRLASLYLRLDSSSVTGEAPDLYASTLAHLLRVEELDPDFVLAYLDTARLYQTQARRHSSAAPHYLALAADQLEKAFALRSDESLRKDLAEMYLQLAQAARTQGEYVLANSYFEKSLEFVPEEDKSEHRDLVLQEIQTTCMAWTASLLEEGRIEEALELARQRLGVDLTSGYRSCKPLLVFVHGDVAMSEAERRIRLTLTPYDERSGESEEYLTDLAARLSATEMASLHLTADENRHILDITVPFQDVRDLLRRLDALADALPLDLDPSLDVLRAILQPRALTFERRETPIGLEVKYLEEVDLAAPAAALLRVREKTRWALMDLEAQKPEDEQSKALRRLALGLLQEYERAWERQAKENRLHYELSLASPSGASQYRGWDLKLGGMEVLSWYGRLYNRRAIIRLTATVIVSLGLLMWLFGTLRSRRGGDHAP